MTMEPGTRLGPYQISSPIGSGGMGVVYRARDTRLGRDVAIKVLPPAFADDPDRLRRFQLEAEATSRLNHPNILAIFDIGIHDGSSYLVTELLEGETVRDRLDGSALPLRKVIDYGLQMAHGLAAAHEKGIVHRDLKPENLFLTRDGRLKILDFGLAKLAAPVIPPDQRREAETVALGTEPGVVMGTVGYMAPEQVRGLVADHRADIFAFGAILYEMISGRRAFHRDSAIETMNAILKEEPPDLSTLGQMAPPALERTIQRCLEKSPEERFQSARDLAFGLETLSGLSGSVRTSGSFAAPPPPEKARRRRVWPALAALAVLAAVASAAFWAGERVADRPQPLYRQLTFRRGRVPTARFIPGSLSIVYGASWEGDAVDLFLTRPGSFESRPVGTPDSDILAVSQSGELAVMLRPRVVEPFLSRGTLGRMPLTGGAPREILDDVEQADWAPDGESLAIVRRVDGWDRLEYPAGKVLFRTPGWIGRPRVSPRGDRIAFIDHPRLGNDRGSIAIVDRDGKVTRLADGWSSANGLSWSASGDEVWFSAASVGMNTDLYAVNPSGRRRVVERVPGRLTLQDIAADGRVLMTHNTLRWEIVGRLPGDAKEHGLSWLEQSFAADLSADGKTLLVSEWGEAAGPNYAVYLRKASGEAVRLGDGDAQALSPDGKWALAILRKTPSRLILLPTGAGEARTLPNEGGRNYPSARWFPDGRRILFSAAEAGHGVRLHVQPIDGGPSRPITPEGVDGGRFAIAPDGRSVAAIDPAQQVTIYPIDGGEPRPVAGLEPEDVPIRWAADGRALYVRHRTGFPVQVDRFDLAGRRREPWKEFMPADPAGVVGVISILPSADGTSYAYTYIRELSVLYQVEGLE